MIQSLDRAMTILSILEQKNTASVTEIAEELGVNKSTVSRLMETLKKHDMVQADPATKKYGLGFKILYLGEGVKRNINIITIARPFLTKLYDELDESVHLCAFNNDAAYVVDQVQSNKVYNLSATVGMAEPLHSSSVGKCILAFRAPFAAVRLLKDYPLTAYTPKTITDMDILMEQLAIIRSQGYAVDDEEIAYVVDQVQSNKVYNLSATVGMAEPLHSSSVGKCILAFRAPFAAVRLLKDYPLTAYTPKTITDMDILMEQLAIIRSQGYAVDDEEIALGVRCIAAPIYDYRGEVNYSLGVSGTTNNIKPAAMDRYLSALLSASSQISSALGYKCGRQRPEVQPPVPYGDSGREE